MMPRGARGDRDVGEQRDDEPGTDRGPVDRRHHRLRTVDDVQHEVARFAHDARTERVVGDDVVEEVEAPTGGERTAGARDHRDARVGVAVDREPHVRELPVHAFVDRVQPRAVEHDVHDSRFGTLDAEVGERGVGIAHVSRSEPWIARTTVAHRSASSGDTVHASWWRYERMRSATPS